MISRLADQKGFDELLLEGSPCALERILEKNDSAFVIIGTGDSRYVTKLSLLMAKYKNLSVKIAFSLPLSHMAEAGADFFLMPSRFEPCGLNQLYSMRYGTLPVVNSTGGLKDSVKDMTEEDAARIEKMVRKEAPEAEVTIINGGQPVYYFIISAEG